MALKSDGTVVAWGGNGSGESTVPANLTGVIAIAAGYRYSLAIVATPNLIQAPFITDQPVNQTAQVGASAIFTVAATGTQPLSYQWQFNGKLIAGANSPTLTLDFVSAANSGSYSVVVSNPYGSTTSATAVLTTSIPIEFGAATLSPTVDETTPSVAGASQLKTWTGSEFSSTATPNRNLETVVLTHGWIPAIGPLPLTGGIDGWPTDMAKALNSQQINVNIVAWDWGTVAESFPCSPGTAAGHTPSQGQQLGAALYVALGTSYSHPVHFIGHSLGTLVNAAAANYLHGPSQGYDSGKTQMTLFDYAEIATGLGCIGFFDMVFFSSPSGSQTYYQPLPQQFAWADNYISLVGTLHCPAAANAANVILSVGIPTFELNPVSFVGDVESFHAYPTEWYEDTIANPGESAMGFRWSFEDGGITGCPTCGGTVYLQAQTGDEFDLNQIYWGDAESLLSERFQSYHSFAQEELAMLGIGVDTAVASGLVTGTAYAAATAWNFVLNLRTSFQSGSSQGRSPGKPVPLGGPNGGTSTIPAYARIALTFPANALSMSFDFIVQNDGENETFAVALDGTNVLSTSVAALETNVDLNSGPIDVSSYAGETVEFFAGLVGGTSTNVSVTVTNFVVYNASQPLLQSQAVDTNFVVSWPISAQDFGLEATDNLTNCWNAVTDSPAIVNFQYTITNQISGGSRFYRLRKE
jgi:pimeloyl-ACP methyl ester carboxylesterase